MLDSNKVLQCFTAVIILGFATFLFAVDPVWATSHEANPDQAVKIDELAKVGNALLKYVVLAIIIESAMSTLFQWRWFQKRTYRKGWKTPITVIVAFVVLSAYPALDVITDVLAVFGVELTGDHASSGKGWFTRALTALLLAGGSSSFVSIYQKLGLRSPVGADDKKVVEQTSLEVIVDRNEKVSGAVMVQLDDGTPVKVDATQGLFHGVSPGRHLVQASGTASGGANTLFASLVVDVNPAKLNSCGIEFR